MEMVADKPVVINITGMGRSGSTLLAAALAQAEGFLCIGELRNIWTDGFTPDQLCSCGSPFATCRFWQTVVAEVRQTAPIVGTPEFEELRSYVERFRHQPMQLSGVATRRYQAALRMYAEILGCFYHSIQRVSGARFIIDSCKRPLTTMVLRHVPGIEVRLLHLVRDSRGVAFSWARKKRRSDTEDGTKLMRRYRATATSRRWLFRNLMAEFILPRFFPGGTHRVKYEDFIREPAATLAGIYQYLQAGGTSPACVNGDQLVLSKTNHMAHGNPGRVNNGVVTLGLDEAWATQMSRRDRRLVTTITWPLLLKYGYPLRVRR